MKRKTTCGNSCQKESLWPQRDACLYRTEVSLDSWHRFCVWLHLSWETLYSCYLVHFWEDLEEIDDMALLAKKSAYNRLKQRPAKSRNPFQNVDVATTKDIGSSMRALMGSDADASTKQLMFSSLLNHYRDSFKKATGKCKRLDKGQNLAKKNTKRDSQQRNPDLRTPKPRERTRDDNDEERRSPPPFLPISPSRNTDC